MSTSIWKQLFENTAQLTKPGHVEKLVSAEDISAIHLLIIEVIQTFLKQGNTHLGFKTYIDKKLRNDLADRMIAHPPTADISLEKWANEIFGEDKFGIVMNSLEEYSNQFAERAASIAAPLLDIAGLPLGGLSFLFFMGNYGFTPFGVHKDAPGEDGFLFHLGPGTKQFYTWDYPEYNSIAHYSKVFHDYEKMLSNAQRYELKPGDVMFIPHQVYHIANTAEFSLSFTMDYINPPKDHLENQLALAVGEENRIFQNSYWQPLKMDSPL